MKLPRISSLALALYSFSAMAADPPAGAIRGFSQRDLAKQRALEENLKAIPQPGRRTGFNRTIPPQTRVGAQRAVPAPASPPLLAKRVA